MIVYYKFADYLRRHDIKRKDIIVATGISSATLANLSANKSVSTDTIGKLCKFLNCQPQDIMEFVDKEGEKNDNNK